MDGRHLSGVPLAEAHKLNQLKDDIRGEIGEAIELEQNIGSNTASTHKKPHQHGEGIQNPAEGSRRGTVTPARTHPLFPPLPLYGPSSIMRDVQCYAFRISSFFLSLAFLGIIILGSAIKSIPMMFTHIWLRLTLRNPDARRPFYQEEKRLQKARKEDEKCWKKQRSGRRSATQLDRDNEDQAGHGEYVPTEGGPDPLVCDVGYYARRVGLDVEEFSVQTEDGFVICLWHIYNPLEFTPLSAEERAARGPDIFTGEGPSRPSPSAKKPKFPVLMMHGLLQSSGAYCTTDEKSLAFYLCKSGYDVWLGNNRCGFKPEHTHFSYSDPRMWAWNIRQMGVMDLPALTSRVLSETNFEKLGLIAHSQGTTQTFVALAKEQCPELGDRLTVFCALAPAAYAGPLIGKAYFKFMRIISPVFFRLIFGIHAFIPFMMTMHRIMPRKFYGAMGYRVFSFLFDWSDDRWDRGLRDRMFQFSPVYVSAESMRWWLGPECFAKQKCILATREESHREDHEDEMEDYYNHILQHPARPTGSLERRSKDSVMRREYQRVPQHERKKKGATAWYDDHVPPFALWVAGSDELVDGRRLLKRFERGREPHVRVVHQKIIEEYEHLDVIWAMDCVEKVGKALKEVLWKTCNVRDKVRVPLGCEDVELWVDPKTVVPAHKGEGESGEMNDSQEDSGQSGSSSSDE